MLDYLSVLGARMAVRGFIGSMVAWAAFALIAMWGGATWPHRVPNLPTCFTQNPLVFHLERCQTFSRSDQWQTFIMLGAIVQGCLFISYMMIVMTYEWDWLGFSLVAFFAALGLLFLLGMAGLLWPSWGGIIAFRFWIRLVIILVLGFAVVQLLMIPNRPRSRRELAPADASNGGT